MEINVWTSENKALCEVHLSRDATVGDLKEEIAKQNKELPVHRQGIRSTAKGKNLMDGISLKSLNVRDGGRLFIKDLGPQISWKTVFLLEYSGPPIIYFVISLRPSFIYGDDRHRSFTKAALIALMCWVIHFMKRLYETMYVHRFSHSTMPIRNLFKNCLYYWGFALGIALHINHPYYTPPNKIQTITGLLLFAICEIGNFSVHLLFRDLRPSHTTIRKVPIPNRNIFTKLFYWVSCPNYTYEFGAWLSFAVMTNCVPAYVFAFVGLYQMSVWAIEKRKVYMDEFENYHIRKAIIPLVL